MFRITPYIISSRTLLYRRRPFEVRIERISQTQPNFKYKNPLERDTCKVPPPPPPPPPRDDSLFWGAMAIVFMAGGFAIYAKSQPEVRDWLSIHLPWFDDLIAIMYQENMTYSEFALQCADDLKRYIAEYRKEKPKECSLDGESFTMIGPQEAPDEEPCDDEDAEEETPCDKLPPPVVTKDICEIERCLKDLGETVIFNMMTAREACSYYNKLVEEAMSNFSIKGVKDLHEAMEERLALVKESVTNATDATAKLDELSRYLECGMKAPKEAIENTKAMLKEYRDQIKTVSHEYQWENDRSLAMDVQWQKVETVVDKYTEENKTMFRGLNYESKKPAIQGDPDLLLHHSLRYAEQLRAELGDAVSGMTERVNRAVETLPQGEKEKRARDGEIQYLYKRKKAEMDREYRKRFDDQRAANDKILRESLKIQLERSQEALVIRLQEKEVEAVEKLNKLVTEKVISEKRLMKKQLNEMSLKLKMVEDKLNARLKAERETRRSQELWTAGASLLNATKKGEPYVNVDRELQAIEKASGDGDKLVQTVLKAIPKSVREQGLVPESVLREKYHLMEETALKVALVEQDGAPLPIYFLSYLQSMLLFMKMMKAFIKDGGMIFQISGIPQDEIDKPPNVPSKDLDTFDLLQRARFWIERGNIANALRYVNSLEGASRGASVAWRDAARSYLETRQAAEAVLAHAAALGLQYI